MSKSILLTALLAAALLGCSKKEEASVPAVSVGAPVAAPAAADSATTTAREPEPAVAAAPPLESASASAAARAMATAPVAAGPRAGTMGIRTSPNWGDTSARDSATEVRPARADAPPTRTGPPAGTPGFKQ